MKANPRSRANSFAKGFLPRILAASAASTGLLAGCVPPPPSMPTPPPAQEPAAPAPAQRPAPSRPQPAPNTDWRDAAQTAGQWTYAGNGTASGATFGSGQFVVQCDPGRSTMTLLRAGPSGAGSATLTIMTSTGTSTLSGTRSGRGIGATVSPRDPVLDAMAFSRGRFAVAAPGEPTLYLPSWTEISRVIEDCR
ncbi:hypothetical protein [Novosphingobium panipatense]|nr:hypothetical protein [Novosphingobium panipatense]